MALVDRMTPEQLLSHIDSGEPWPASLPADAFGDPAAACQTALAVRALRIARGEIPRGYKIGFTNRGLWERYGVHAPIWGTVWDTTLTQVDGDSRAAPDDGAAATTLSLQGLCQPRIEPEVVFGLKAAPADGAGLDVLFDAIDWVATGFEIVQSHRPGWRFNAADTLADSGLHGRLRVGPRRPLSGLASDAGGLVEMLQGTTVVLQHDGADVDEGGGANVLGSPLHALRHFVDELRACPGAPQLRAGDIVTTGTWTDAWPVRAGERWCSRYGARLPDLQIDFS
ncbi:MAG: hydratase [Rubrivivax sp.]